MKTSFRPIVHGRSLSVDTSFSSHILEKSNSGDLEFILPTLYFQLNQETQDATHTREVAYVLWQLIDIRNEKNYISSLQKQILINHANFHISMASSKRELKEIYEQVMAQLEMPEQEISKEHIKWIQKQIEDKLETQMIQMESRVPLRSIQMASMQTKEFVNAVKNRVNIRDDFKWKQSKRQFHQMFFQLSRQQQEVLLQQTNVTFDQVHNITKMNQEEWKRFSREFSDRLTVVLPQIQENHLLIEDELVEDIEYSEHDIINMKKTRLIELLQEEDSLVDAVLEGLVKHREIKLLEEVKEWIRYLEKEEWETVESALIEQLNYETPNLKILNILTSDTEEINQTQQTDFRRKNQLLELLQEDNVQVVESLAKSLLEHKETKELVSKWFEDVTDFESLKTNRTDVELVEEIKEWISYLDETEWKTVEATLVEQLTYETPNLKILNILTSDTEETNQTLQTDFRRKNQLLELLQEDNIQMVESLARSLVEHKDTKELVSKWFEDVTDFESLKINRTDTELVEEIKEWISYLDETEWKTVENTLVEQLTYETPNLKILNILTSDIEEINQIQQTDFRRKNQLLELLQEDNIQVVESLTRSLLEHKDTKELVSKWFENTDNYESLKINRTDTELVEEIKEWISYLDETEWKTVENTLVEQLTYETPNLKILNILTSDIEEINQTQQTDFRRKNQLLELLQEDNVQVVESLAKSLLEHKETKELVSKWFEDVTDFESLKINRTDTELVEEVKEWISYLDETEWKTVESTLVEQLNYETPNLKILNILTSDTEETNQTLQTDFRRKNQLLELLQEDNIQMVESLARSLVEHKETKELVSKWFEDVTDFESLKINRTDTELVEEIKEWISYLDETEWKTVENTLVEQLTYETPNLKILNILTSDIEEINQIQQTDFRRKNQLLELLQEDNIQVVESLTRSLLEHKETKELVSKWFEDVTDFESLKINRTDTELVEEVKEWISYLDETEWKTVESTLVEQLTDFRRKNQLLELLQEDNVQVVESLAKSLLEHKETKELVSKWFENVTDFKSLKINRTNTELVEEIKEWISYLDETEWKTVESTLVEQLNYEIPNLKILNILTSDIEETNQIQRIDFKRKNQLLELLQEDNIQVVESLAKSLLEHKETKELVSKWFEDVTDFKSLKINRTDTELVEEIKEWISYLDETEWKTVESTLVEQLNYETPNLKILNILTSDIEEINQTQQTDFRRKNQLLELLQEDNIQVVESLARSLLEHKETKELVSNWFEDVTDFESLKTNRSDIKLIEEMREWISYLDETEWKTVESTLVEQLNYKTPNLRILNILKSQQEEINQDLQTITSHNDSKIQELHYLSFAQNKIENKKREFFTKKLEVKELQEDVSYEIANYEVASRYMAKKQVQEVTPMVKTTMEQTRQELLSEIVNVRSYVESTQKETSNTKQADLDQFMKRLQEQERQLEHIKEEQKGVLRKTDISHITKTMEKQMQSSLRIERLRKGVF